MLSFRQTKLLAACLFALSGRVAANGDNQVIDRSTISTRNSSEPILQTKGGITRHLGITRSSAFETVFTWFLNPNGKLSWLDLGSLGGWRTYSLSFISAPEVLNLWDSSSDLRVAFAIQAGTGHMMYLPYFDGAWESYDKWHDLGGRFTYRPASVVGSTGLSGIFGVNEDGQLLYSALDNQYFLPLKWSNWAVMGTGFTGEVSAASASPGVYELVGLVNGTYQYGLADYRGSPIVWTDLGLPTHGTEFGWPKIIVFENRKIGSNQRGFADVVVAVDGVIWHKYYNGTSWPAEWTRLPASHDGLEITNSQELLVGYMGSGPSTAYLFSRGSNDCVYQNQFSYSGYNSTTGLTYYDWRKWNNLWCPTGNSSTSPRSSPLSMAAIALDDNRFDFIVETPSGTLEHSQVYHDNGSFEGVVPKWAALKAHP